MRRHRTWRRPASRWRSPPSHSAAGPARRPRRHRPTPQSARRSRRRRHQRRPIRFADTASHQGTFARRQRLGQGPEFGRPGRRSRRGLRCRRGPQGEQGGRQGLGQGGQERRQEGPPGPQSGDHHGGRCRWRLRVQETPVRRDPDPEQLSCADLRAKACRRSRPRAAQPRTRSPTSCPTRRTRPPTSPTPSRTRPLTPSTRRRTRCRPLTTAAKDKADDAADSAKDAAEQGRVTQPPLPGCRQGQGRRTPVTI